MISSNKPVSTKRQKKIRIFRAESIVTKLKKKLPEKFNIRLYQEGEIIGILEDKPR